MKESVSAIFYHKLRKHKKHRPLNGQIELTYNCNLNCIHCYCKDERNYDEELDTLQWKKIITDIKKQGCLYLTFTGGEPLIRSDFLEIYSYAKKNGFIIIVFSNGQLLKGKILDYLVKSPPFSIEITLNGITKETYETISQTKGAFAAVMENIKRIKEKKLPLILKSNCLKQNKHEIAKIKSFADGFLGKKKTGFHFKYDTMIYPRLNRDKTPADYRLSFNDILELRKTDADIWKEYQNGLRADSFAIARDKDFLYRCDSWMTNFFINPYGRLKFCQFSHKFSTDLKTTTFEEGFYKTFPRLLNERFKTPSRCKSCRLRSACYYCPARASLETGNEEAPVPYYCALAKELAAQMKRDRFVNRHSPVATSHKSR